MWAAPISFSVPKRNNRARLHQWIAAGIGHYRVEFTHETAGQVRRIAQVYLRAIRGDLSPDHLAAELRALVPAGITEGSLIIPGSPNELHILQ